MKRSESRKSHSYSHGSLKNSRWLAENLDEMDHRVKRMLKLVEDDGDSFAKKAEMYYRKRPELVSQVDEFYRMYRSLAERYDHLTVELRKNVPSDLQSQGSGMSVSELSYETPPPSLPSPDLRLARCRSGQQPAGFDFFLGAGGGGSTDNSHKEADESSSLTDSDPDCDACSVNNYSIISGIGSEQALQARVFELENELLDMKEKLLRVQYDEVASDASSKEVMIKKTGSDQDPIALYAHYEEELRMAKEEISRLKIELRKYGSEAVSGKFLDDGQSGSGVEELREKLRDSRDEIVSLKKELESTRRLTEKNQKMSDQLESALKDAAGWRTKFNAEKRDVAKLQERLARLKSSLSDRDHEIRELKIAVSDAEEKIFPEKSHIKAEIAKLLEERTRKEEHLRDWESRGRLMEEENRKVKAEMLQKEETLSTIIEQLKSDIADRDRCLVDLTRSFDAMRSDKDGLRTEVSVLKADVSAKDSHILEINERMHRLQREYTELRVDSDRTRGMVEALRSMVDDLEGEVEKQRLTISEGAEEKREAIRQLCFSLEHYRSGYHSLRHAFLGHTSKQLRRTSVAY